MLGTWDNTGTLAWETLSEGNMRLDGGEGKVRVRTPKTWFVVCTLSFQRKGEPLKKGL